MSDVPLEQPKQSDLVAQPSAVNPAPNPFAHAASISVSVPEAVEIKLVDASALADYEVWVLLTSILSSAFVGFVVATLQADGQPVQRMMLAVSVLTAILLVVCAGMAISKRNKLTANKKRLRFRIGEQMEE
ncbi:MAG: hypothetical protein HYU77_17500 [Betaproteobacteria bacterium]|nr:hypothetical protein [Betaproteobacteria bacterium]